MEIAVIVLSSLLLICILVCGFTVLTLFTALKNEKARFDNLTNSIFDYRMIWDENLAHVEFSDKLKTLLVSCGINPDKDYIKSVFRGNGFNLDGDLSLCVNALRKSGTVSEYYSAEGLSGLIHWKSVSFTDKKGKVTVYSLGRDISGETISRKVTEELREEFFEEFDNIRRAEENALAGYISFFAEGDAVYVKTTPRICGLWGFENTDTIPLDSLYSLMKAEDMLEVQRDVARFLSGVSDEIYAEVFIKSISGAFRSYTIQCRYNKGVADYHNIRTGLIFDTTSGRISKEEAYKEKQKDPITGLFNRTGFMLDGKALLEKYKSEGKSAVLICIHVTRLRKISLLFGIEVSDTLSKLYAEALTSLADDEAVIGKVGAEDFALVIKCNEKEEAENLMKSISIVVENHCDNKTLPAVLKEQSSFLAGACFYDGMDDIAALYNKASVTLFSGTREPGKICCFFDLEVEKKVSGRDIVENEIGEALKHGDLELYYQPKISIKTGEIVGAEALMRWNHKTQGMIMPNEFIHIAEEMGIITKIDEWGLLQACKQNKMWQDKGYPPIVISVNMSQAQLYQTDVVTTVKEALKESGIDPKYIEVELTETMAMVDIDRTVSILNSLKALGVSISMDDFGTGYSSLSSLKLLPIDLLKIDRSLVYDIETNSTARHITKAICELGKAMNLTLLAEGVENTSQRDILEELGCDYIQGFLYSKPQPAAIVEKNFLIPSLDKQAQTVAQ